MPCPSALAQAAGERLYRTGDLARYLPDGRLEVFGRRDHQIKLRGIRVEPEEIETVLAEHPEILEAAVVPRDWGGRETAGGDVRLVAYVVTGAQVPESAELRAFLAARLPDPLVPRLYVAVESLPLTANRKVDRSALRRRPLPAEQQERKPARPASELERRVAEIWREVLAVDKVGLDDNFFDLGGHSLLLVRVHSLLRELVDREFTLLELFRYPTIRTLADFLAEDAGEVDRAAPSVWVPVPDERRIAIIGLSGRRRGAVQPRPRPRSPDPAGTSR